MNQSTLPSENHDCNLAPDTIVDELQSILLDVSAFTTKLFEDLDQAIELQDPQSTTDNNLSKQPQNFEQEKRRWEAKRKREAAELQDQANQLTQAWLRLETEQREFAQMRMATPQGTVVQTTATPSAEIKSPGNLTNLGDAQQRGSDERSLAQSLAVETNRSREAAVDQFQRLRREMSSRRTREH